MKFCYDIGIIKNILILKKNYPPGSQSQTSFFNLFSDRIGLAKKHFLHYLACRLKSLKKSSKKNEFLWNKIDFSCFYVFNSGPNFLKLGLKCYIRYIRFYSGYFSLGSKSLNIFFRFFEFYKAKIFSNEDLI